MKGAGICAGKLVGLATAGHSWRVEVSIQPGFDFACLREARPWFWCERRLGLCETEAMAGRLP